MNKLMELGYEWIPLKRVRGLLGIDKKFDIT